MKGAVSVMFDGATVVALAERAQRLDVPAEQIVREATQIVLAMPPERRRVALGVLAGKSDAAIAADENQTTQVVADMRRGLGLRPNRRTY